MMIDKDLISLAIEEDTMNKKKLYTTFLDMSRNDQMDLLFSLVVSGYNNTEDILIDKIGKDDSKSIEGL